MGAREAPARAPRRHAVRVLVQGPAETVRERLPTGLALLEEAPHGWVRVALEAEALDWVPGLLAGLRLPFRVEAPEELRVELRSVAAG